MSHRVLRDYSPQIRDVFFIRRVQLDQKHPKTKSPGATIWFIVHNKEFTWCASFLLSKYPGNGHIYALVSKMYQEFANYAKTTTYFLVLKGKIEEIFHFIVCKVCCPCASFHTWPPDPHNKLLIYSLQYNSWWKFVRDMTPFQHHPSSSAKLLVHQSHIQSTFHVHQSECMRSTTKQNLTHSKLEVSPFIHVPLTQNSGENPPKITGDLASLGVEPTTFGIESCGLAERKRMILVLMFEWDHDLEIGSSLVNQLK